MTTTLTTLVNFDGTHGADPGAGLIADAAGNLFGTTQGGGANAAGTVFEIAFAGGSYASTPTILASFNGTNGSVPVGGLIADVAGDLFGTTANGGANGDGTVFELVNDGLGSYNLTTLVSFNGTNGQLPFAGLLADAAGNLFGTTQLGGANGAGTVFEIPYSGGSYASTPITLISFNGTTNGNGPQGALIADAAGNLFGTTELGGATADGTVFEIVKTGGSYASTPTTLVSFNYTDGAYPQGALIFDAAGNLFGTTQQGGTATNVNGTVFEIAYTNGTYASAPTTLVSFNGANG